jgi:hypothetical protein
MPFTVIIGIILIISIIIIIVGFTKKIRFLKYIGVTGTSVSILLLVFFITLLSFSDM